MKVIKEVIFLSTFVIYCLAENYDDHTSSDVKDGRQLGAISFLQKIFQIPDQKGYPSSPFLQSCPLCDSSVYSYCGERLFHDACCCTSPYEHELPYQCKLADCKFLHANTCRAHNLIANCCCSDEYRSLLKGSNP